MSLHPSHDLSVWVGAFLTLCIFSFLYKDNPFYRFAEHLFVGVSAGYFIILNFWTVIVPNLWEPLKHSFAVAGGAAWLGVGTVATEAPEAAMETSIRPSMWRSRRAATCTSSIGETSASSASIATAASCSSGGLSVRATRISTTSITAR